MTTRELINELLDSPMDTEISLYLEGNHTDEYGRECSGWLFPIDSVEHGVLIKFTDWRAEQTCENCKRTGIDKCFSCDANPYIPKIEPIEKIVWHKDVGWVDEAQTDCAWK